MALSCCEQVSIRDAIHNINSNIKTAQFYLVGYARDRSFLPVSRQVR